MISVKTPQNVVIDYEYAEGYQRIVAFVVDVIILWFSSVILTVIGEFLKISTVMMVVAVLHVTLYSLWQENLFKGRTLGKMILGIKVIKLNGSKPQFSDYFLRWLFKPVDGFFSWFSLAVVLFTVSEKKQRLGDMLASTTVVSTRFNEKKLSLSKIEEFNSNDNYEQKYELISRFTEEEMVLIKSCLYRKSKYKNVAHQKIFDEMVDKMVKRLELPQKPKKKEQFVKDVIKDYVLVHR